METSCENELFGIQLAICLSIIAKSPINETPQKFATSMQKAFILMMNSKVDIENKENMSITQGEQRARPKSVVKLGKSRSLQLNTSIQGEHKSRKSCNWYPRRSFEFPAKRNIFPSRKIMTPHFQNDFKDTENPATSVSGRSKFASQHSNEQMSHNANIVLQTSNLPSDRNKGKFNSLSELELLWKKGLHNKQVEKNQKHRNVAQRLKYSLIKNLDRPLTFEPAIKYEPNSSQRDLSDCLRKQLYSFEFNNSMNFIKLFSGKKGLHLLKKVSAFEVINIKVFFDSCADKKKAIHFILIDFYETFCSAFINNENFPKELSNEITEILEASVAEAIIDQDVIMSVISFYDLVFKFLIQTDANVGTRYNLVMEIFSFIKDLKVLGTKFMLTSGHFTTCIICDLLQRGPESVLPEIEYYIVDVLRSFIIDLKEVKKKSDDDTSKSAVVVNSSTPHLNIEASSSSIDENQSRESNFSMVDKALEVLSHFFADRQPPMEFSIIDVLDCSGRKTMFNNWHMLLQKSLMCVSDTSVFTMQVKALLPLLT